MDIATMILFVLGYPFIAAWIVGTGRSRRLSELENEVIHLRRQIEESVLSSSSASPSRQPADENRQAEQFASTTRNETPASAHLQYRVVQASTGTLQTRLDSRRRFKTSQTIGHSADTERAAEAAESSHAQSPVTLGKSEPVMTDTASLTVNGSSSIGGLARPPKRPLPNWTKAAMGWLFTGNLVAKLGLVILFIGVGFLLKYVAESVFVPIEIRLTAVVTATVVLLGWGWRLCKTRREIGLPVQGTAIAILMLVVFGAYHRYELMPAAFAFGMLIVLTAFTCLLADLQESPWLAAFGITGGFASPVLLSTAAGQHLSLFSYYALLNLGVFVLAIKRAWRPLNLLGFGFTFIIGTAWGGLHYAPANYAAAQAFLGLFFLLYVGIALAFARQQQTRLKDYVDATLVLGTPLLVFGLQAGLVKDKPFGMALSALALGSFYLVLATMLWRRGRERWRVLAETFMALGVIFGTLTIPFALDGRWTSGMWALEGAGFVWFGLRRKQRLTWAFGVLLQTGAWMGFIGAATGLDPEAARTSNLWLGFLLLAGSTFAMATGFRRHAADDQPRLSRIANWCLVIAAAWLLAGSWTEAILQTRGGLLANLLTASALLTAGLLYLCGARLAWPLAWRLAMAAQVAGAFALLVVSTVEIERLRDSGEPLLGVFIIAIAALATSRVSERMPDTQFTRRFPNAFLLWGGAWWFGAALAISAYRLRSILPAVFGTSDVRWTAIYALLVAVSASACSRLAPKMNWTGLRWLGASSWGMLALITLPILITLYDMRTLPEPGIWLAWVALLCSSEYVLWRWTTDNAPLNDLVLRCVHAVRTAGPWLAIWPVGAILIGPSLVDMGESGEASGHTDWALSAAWSNYLPTWAMMLVLAWLLRRSSAAKWPTAPLVQWYRSIVIPCGALLVLMLAAIWNLLQDGSMAPLPYLPLLNPLDLTTGFALLLGITVVHGLVGGQHGHDRLLLPLKIGGAVTAYVWFNLILLRSAAQYRDIPYRLEELAASQFVQAMLSLVWCASALVLMRVAATRTMRRSWCAGALLLAVVVLKLFTVDLANSGSLARVVSFVGVGLLMVLVGYFAPFPKAEKDPAAVSSI